MDTLIPFDKNLLESIAWTIIHSLWIGAFLGMVLYTMLQSLSNRSAKIKYQLAVSFFFSFFFLTIATFSYLNIENKTAEIQLIPNSTPPKEITVVPTANSEKQFSQGYIYQVGETQTSSWGMYLPMVTYLWLFGFVICLLRMMLGYRYLHTIKSSAIQLPLTIVEKCNAISKDLGFPREIKIVQSEKVASPFMAGWWKPIIYLPLALQTQLTPKEMEAILAHEIAHIIRQDYPVKFLQSFVQILCYYHPVIWWMSNIIDEEREHCCDDLAVAHTEDPLSFAQALAQVASFGNVEIPSLTLGFAQKKQHTLNRIKRLFSQETVTVPKSSSKIFVALTLVLMIAFSTVSPLTNWFGQGDDSNYITYDIENFWNAYDKITTTKDSIQQYTYLKELYLDKASPGLIAFCERKGYTAEDYIEAINNYPRFWASIRPNTLQAEKYAKEIEVGVNQLKKLYPDLKASNIYFTIGALRSGGTTLDGRVLIGAEIAMANENTVTDELPDWLKTNLRAYFDTNPINDITFLNVHEYVHTQQKTQGGHELLSQCVYEGIAEFVTVIATGQESPVPAIAYGKANDARIQERFAKELLSPYYMNWLYNNFNNEFNTRDLGYYVGYAISEKYYEKAADKSQAIKELMELSFTDPKDMQDFVATTGYFSNPMKELIAIYNANQPKVISIEPFENGAQHVDPNIKEITIHFNMPMAEEHTNFELGPLGMDHRLSIEKVIGFSADKKSFTIGVDLQQNHRHQAYVNFGFRNLDGIRLEPFLIDFKTKE